MTEYNKDVTADLQRFWAKVEVHVDGCWLWLASVNEKGYGRFQYSGRCGYAHRFIYEQLVGPIPDGLVIDHLCRVRNCVRLDHLEPVTPLENGLRGSGVIARALLPTCIHGHLLEGHNLIFRSGTGKGIRACRTCGQVNQARYHSRKKGTR